MEIPGDLRLPLETLLWAHLLSESYQVLLCSFNSSSNQDRFLLRDELFVVAARTSKDLNFTSPL